MERCVICNCSMAGTDACNHCSHLTGGKSMNWTEVISNPYIGTESKHSTCKENPKRKSKKKLSPFVKDMIRKLKENDMLSLELVKHYANWCDDDCDCEGEEDCQNCSYPLLGVYVAIQFGVGISIVKNLIVEIIVKLSEMPHGSHIGQTDYEVALPEIYLTRYDHEFFIKLYAEAELLTESMITGISLYPRNIAQEILLEWAKHEWQEFLESVFADECPEEDLLIFNDPITLAWNHDLAGDDDVEWIFDEPMGIAMLTPDSIYHFDNWYE